MATESDVRYPGAGYFCRFVVLASSCIPKPCGQAEHKYSTIQGILQYSIASGYPVVYSGWPGSLTAGVLADVVGCFGVWYLVPAYYPTAVTSATSLMLEQ